MNELFECRHAKLLSKVTQNEVTIEKWYGDVVRVGIPEDVEVEVHERYHHHGKMMTMFLIDNRKVSLGPEITKYDKDSET
jgi:hypothetical protein